MRSKSLDRCAALGMAAVLGVSVVALPREARADDEVSSTGSAVTGIGGGALLGGEVVWIVEGIAGVRSGWAYLIGGVLGAAGGGAGGYFVEKGSSDGKAPTYMLAGGLGLIIPAVVLMLNGTRYQPEEGATEDRPPAGPPAEPGVPGNSITGAPGTTATPPSPPAPAPPAPAPPPQSLLDLHGGSFRVGVPFPNVKAVFTVSETMQYGLRSQGAELRMPVLHMTF